MSDTLVALRGVIDEGGGPLAESLVGAGENAEPSIGELAAAGDRASGQRDEYRLLVECIFEGYLLHYGQRSRLLAGVDADLALLGGDFLYASGLTRLAQLGDLEAIEQLADLITLCAQLHAPAGADSSGDLAATLWAGTALAVGSGRWPEYEQAKQALREARPEAPELAASSIKHRSSQLGLERELELALIAFRSAFLRTT